MSVQTVLDPDLIQRLDNAAMEYSRKLTDENLRETFAQGTQRTITLASFDLVKRARPEVHCFNEMLIQYPKGKDGTKLGQVVPDNFIVLHPDPLDVEGHYSLHVQPARPFLVIEYVSKHNTRKDYKDNLRLYEKGLQVPYYLLFYPEKDDLMLYRTAGMKYEAVRPISTGRLPIPELELEVALHEGWVRYWFRGELLPLPAELADQRDAADARADAAERERDAAERERDAANARAKTERDARLALEAELERVRDEMARLRGG